MGKRERRERGGREGGREEGREGEKEGGREGGREEGRKMHAVEQSLIIVKRITDSGPVNFAFHCLLLS